MLTEGVGDSVGVSERLKILWRKSTKKYFMVIVSGNNSSSNIWRIFVEMHC